MPVAILEDVVTTGDSALKAIARAREFGLKVSLIVGLVDRERRWPRSPGAGGTAAHTLPTEGVHLMVALCLRSRVLRLWLACAAPLVGCAEASPKPSVSPTPHTTIGHRLFVGLRELDATRAAGASGRGHRH